MLPRIENFKSQRINVRHKELISRESPSQKASRGTQHAFRRATHILACLLSYEPPAATHRHNFISQAATTAKTRIENEKEHSQETEIHMAKSSPRNHLFKRRPKKSSGHRAALLPDCFVREVHHTHPFPHATAFLLFSPLFCSLRSFWSLRSLRSLESLKGAPRV